MKLSTLQALSADDRRLLEGERQRARKGPLTYAERLARMPDPCKKKGRHPVFPYTKA